MTGFPRLPIRARVTAAFAVVTAVLLAGISVAVYLSVSAALLDELDSGLRFRAAAASSISPHAVVERQDPRLEEPGEAFDQLLTRNASVLRSSPAVAGGAILSAPELAALHGPTFLRRHVTGVADTARLLVLPLADSGSTDYLVVGASMSDRTDELRHLLIVLLIGTPIALALGSAAGWVVAGVALRPVERMRRQASAITASGLDHRLDLPAARDELHRLGSTLNDMLARLDAARRHDQEFIARASHELRTPLTSLKAELDLATKAPRTVAELTAALASASDETDRLARLANDLLVLARAEPGRLPIRRQPTAVGPLLQASAASFRSVAATRGVELSTDGDDAVLEVDPIRVRQALDNLVDNALRHTPPGGVVRLRGGVTEQAGWLTVSDSGPGFDTPAALSARLEAAATTSDGEGRGLGLRICHAIVTGHGGRLLIGNPEGGGASVTMTFPPLSSGAGPARPVDAAQGDGDPVTTTAGSQPGERR